MHIGFPAVVLARARGLALIALVAGLTASPRVGAQSTALIPAASTWRYLDDGRDMGTAWRTASFDDGAWRSGAAQLGYGDGDESTVVSFGADPGAKPITTYFRRTFQVADPASLGSLNLRLLRDDGAVVFLNGVEVFRTNMPAGTITSATRASTAIAGSDEASYVAAVLSTAPLLAGANVIAVELHQSDPSSSDISFDLELTGGSAVAVTRGPYLQSASPTSMVVRWRTSTPVIGRVEAGPAPGVVTLASQETVARTDHEIRLNGLTAETLYYYSIGTPTARLAGDDTFRFRTPPQPGTERPTRVWVLGDSGTADAGARAVRDAYAAFTGSRETDLWLMLGDNAYNDGLDHEYQAAVFDMYPAMLRRTVLWPAYGNHDGYGADAAANTGPYFDIFTLPKGGEAGGVGSGTEAYYSFDHANIHFVALESFETNRSPDGPMLTWLRRDLAANTRPWVIAFFHHPPYSKGSHDSDREVELMEMRQYALPILEQFGVDLVLAGHSHSFERSLLLDGHYGDSSTFAAHMVKDGGSGRPEQSGPYLKPTYGMAPREGAVYVVAGVSGRISGGTLNHPAMFTSQAVLGSLVLDIAGTRLDASFVDSTGVRRDAFSIVKGSAPAPVTGPFAGTPASIPGLFQAEDFDLGPAGTAYADTTSGNSGGAYRTTDVDIEPSVDAGAGFNVSKTRAGEWLTYTVNVGTTGTYALEARVANIGTGARFRVEVDGVDRTGPIDVPHTGGWQTWQTISVPGIPLNAGVRVLRVVLASVGSSGGVGNYNWFRLVNSNVTSSPAYGGTPAQIPGLIQAENFDVGPSGTAYSDASAGNSGAVYRVTDVDIGPTGDPGSGGYYVGWTRTGEWLTYTVEVTESRSFDLSVRVANVGSGATFRVDIDGVDRTGPIQMPNTGGWDLWQTVRIGGLPLAQGRHVIRLVMLTRNAENAGVGNFSYLRFE